MRTCPTRPVSAVEARPEHARQHVREGWKFCVIASFAIDISGPGSCPARIFAIALWFV